VISLSNLDAFDLQKKRLECIFHDREQKSTSPIETSMTVREASAEAAPRPPAKRLKASAQEEDYTRIFAPLLLSTAPRLAESYAASQPYKHAVVDSLFDVGFLLAAREELLGLNFREKETDIYKVCCSFSKSLACSVFF
jgi:hypothetical protein